MGVSEKPLICKAIHLLLISCKHLPAVLSLAAGSVLKHPCSTSSMVPSVPLCWWGFYLFIYFPERITDRLICLLQRRRSGGGGGGGWGGCSILIHIIRFFWWNRCISLSEEPLTHFPSACRIHGINLIRRAGPASKKADPARLWQHEVSSRNPFATACSCFKPLKWCWRCSFHTGHFCCLERDVWVFNSKIEILLFHHQNIHLGHAFMFSN